MIQWLIGGIERVRAAFNTMVYRMSPVDTTGPTVVHILRGN
jgi:hypothetical protein